MNKFLITCLFLIFSGCGGSFQPYEKNDKYPFSIFGYFDASADTQWVRISPARQEFNTSADVPDMKVTLKNMQSGESALLKDSLFVPDSAFKFLNFRTTMDIEPGETYELQAESTDGVSSRVTVTIPDEFPTPRFILGVGIGLEPTNTLYILMTL